MEGFQILLAAILVACIILTIVWVAATLLSVPYWSMLGGYALITSLIRIVEWVIGEFIGE